jgi:hypothetical protein
MESVLKAVPKDFLTKTKLLYTFSLTISSAKFKNQVVEAKNIEKVKLTVKVAMLI